MAEDRSSIDVNTRERERLGAFIERVDDEGRAERIQAFGHGGLSLLTSLGPERCTDVARM